MKFPPPKLNAKSKLPPPPQARKNRIHIQGNLIESDEFKSGYTTKIKGPIYSPSERRPHLMELLDQTKAKKFIRRIMESSLGEREREFLIEAAKRHNVFNYKKIADYYSNAPKEMQRLMEESALVIIDFNDAIQGGYVKFTDEVAKIYEKEHGKTP